ncbi:MAG: hypothetical protein MR018_04100 [Clostridiales bacterium]|nr:hypothetical protein [Clostridiales bacterium]
MYIEQNLKARDLPPIPDERAKILAVLSREIYGQMPAPVEASAEIISENGSAYAGKAVERQIRVAFDLAKGRFSFPAVVLIPHAVQRPRLMIHLMFEPSVPNKYFPAEEILDSGCAVAAFCYEDVTADNNDFSSGLASYFPRNATDSTGKIGLWAYAAQRLADAVLAWSCFDDDHVAVIGHSRLGKTALWCAANDTRFSLAVSNNAGCSGDALARGKQGERVDAITRVFPFWFCPNYAQYVNVEETMPFDQHWLLAAIAPRLIFVNTAEQDAWADPESAFLSCAAASEAYVRTGRPGLIAPDRKPCPGDFDGDGSIGFAMRAGCHFLSRADWQAAIRFWQGKA